MAGAMSIAGAGFTDVDHNIKKTIKGIKGIDYE